MEHNPRPVPQPHTFRFGRAAFLGLAGLTAGFLAWGKRLPSPVQLLAAGSNQDGFVIYTIADFPAFHPDTYRLEISGLVEHPRSYTYQDLLARPKVRQTTYYQCVTGWIVQSPRWSGVHLWDLIEAARPTARAKALRFLCLDNAYSESLTLDQARKPGVLLAYGLNGRALSRQQGMPLRLVVPDMFGYKYAKWVNRIEVVDRVIPGYWERNGYDVDAYIGRSNFGREG